MQKIELQLKAKYILPVYYANYLVNFDTSGVDSQEIYDLDRFIIKHTGMEYNLLHHNVTIIADLDNIYFQASNDLNDVAGDVCEYTFLID